MGIKTEIRRDVLLESVNEKDSPYSKLQKNPQSAIIRAEAKNISLLLYSSMVLATIFCLVVFGGIMSPHNKQLYVSNAQNINKHTLEGTITTVTNPNSFQISLIDTQDPNLKTASLSTWNIVLLPKRNTSISKIDFGLCSYGQYKNGLIHDLRNVSCNQIIETGNKVLINFIKFDVDDSLIIADKIIHISNN